jgi:hypothetical protein
VATSEKKKKKTRKMKPETNSWGKSLVQLLTPHGSFKCIDLFE